MTEAVRLVLAMGALEEDEGIFVAEMKEPVKIVDLARDLIKYRQDGCRNRISRYCSPDFAPATKWRRN